MWVKFRDNESKQRVSKICCLKKARPRDESHSLPFSTNILCFQSSSLAKALKELNKRATTQRRPLLLEGTFPLSTRSRHISLLRPALTGSLPWRVSGWLRLMVSSSSHFPYLLIASPWISGGRYALLYIVRYVPIHPDVKDNYNVRRDQFPTTTRPNLFKYSSPSKKSPHCILSAGSNVPTGTTPAPSTTYTSVLSTDNDPNNSAAGGKFASDILTGRWEVALDELNKRREAIERMSSLLTSALANANNFPEPALAPRPLVAHCLL